jgi:predicted outer membrane lipoprotein
MDLSTLANLATALAVLTAVAFGLLEARRARRLPPFKQFSLQNG